MRSVNNFIYYRPVAIYHLQEIFGILSKLRIAYFEKSDQIQFWLSYEN